MMPGQDPLVVWTEDLLKYLDEYCDKHKQKFPDNSQPFQPGPRSYGPLRYLADQMTSQISGGTFRSNINKLEQIRKRKYNTINLRTADQVLTAMGDIHLLGNEIPVLTRADAYGVFMAA